MTKRSIKDILSPSAPLEERFIPDIEYLKEVVKNLQDFGHKVVLTQGVYDLIHEGHGKYLELAKQQGDILIVGVDTDYKNISLLLCKLEILSVPFMNEIIDPLSK